jgi:hypothetical protein
VIDAYFDDTRRDRKELLPKLSRMVTQLKRVRGSAALQRGALLDAELRLLRGDREGAQQALARTVADSDQAVLALEKHGALYLLGALTGGDEGRQLRHRALSWAHEAGFPDPYMPLWMTVPSVRLLEDAG